MKNILVLFFLISFGTYAQKIRPFVGVLAYIDTDFDKSVFGDFKLGADYKLVYYLNPEIEINYMYGVLEKLTNRDDTGLVLSEYSKKVSAVNYSFCPKIILGNKNGDGSGYLQILPKYTYSSIEASVYRVSRNPSDLSKPIEEKEKISDNQHSFGIGLGYVVDFSDENSQSLALNIYFNNIDLGNALNMLK
ncbi:hypothetical protein B0A75_11980 [Flavobacterium oncorhynchi]|uniref:Outer membrane protein beta-barrel domain-containing protein n=1 Tax=Flavobacterium oncorhynchi TaxID=728056 RepID=A0A226HY18_9FLAO|nr:hypothetical protein [Flavobacterium oncorhynchi]OXA99139.1 hypothetical protein B0A75_11980 [Flavobacterium oncorhynchi]